jgi:hypothetical protein
MELVSGAGVAEDAGDCPAEPEIAGFTQVTWRKSSWSSFNGNCVEVAELGSGQIGVRDTKDRGVGPTLLFGDTAWRVFIDGVKNGRFSV